MDGALARALETAGWRNPLRRIFMTAAAFAALAATAAAQPLDGRYTVQGTNFDGSPYLGEVVIATSPQGQCTIAWTVSGSTSKGRCSQQGATLSADYELEGRKGHVVYAVGPDGRLDGKWKIDGQGGAGTEVLTPVKAASAADGARGAVDFVRSLYASEPIYNPGFDEPFEARLTGPALAAVEKNAKESAASGEIACIDFVLSLNAQDSDEPTVRRTLELTEIGAPQAGQAKVDASFINFEFEGIPADQQTRTVVEYDLQEVGGTWRISDMSAKAVGDSSFGWRLSELCR